MDTSIDPRRKTDIKRFPESLAVGGSYPVLRRIGSRQRCAIDRTLPAQRIGMGPREIQTRRGMSGKHPSAFNHRAAMSSRHMSFPLPYGKTA